MDEYIPSRVVCSGTYACVFHLPRGWSHLLATLLFVNIQYHFGLPQSKKEIYVEWVSPRFSRLLIEFF